MKLLILTQKVDLDDDVLGFFHEWIREFSNRVEKLTVICLQKGRYDLPGNASVVSLGKETGVSRLKYLFNFYKYIWQYRNEYDAVLVHMNIEYIILGAFIWKMLNKKIGFWYVHSAVSWRLRLAEKFTDVIFTASLKSFRLQSKKVKILSQGINGEVFKPADTAPKNNSIISVGRIAPVKNYHFLIEAAKILRDRGEDFDIKIVGAPILEADKVYFETLKKQVEEANLTDGVSFIGGVPYKDIVKVYTDSKIFINLSDTGSIDKAVLEAMASGLLVLTSNEAFRDILNPQYFTSKDPAVVADKLSLLMKQGGDSDLRRYVIENHGLKNLIDKIILEYTA